MHKNMHKLRMRFTWNESKRQSNLIKHGLDFKDGPQVFAGATFSMADTRFDYGEDRFVTIGLLVGNVVVIVHSEDKDEIRIISMRKGTKNEQKIYFENI